MIIDQLQGMVKSCMLDISSASLPTLQLCSLSSLLVQSPWTRTVTAYHARFWSDLPIDIRNSVKL